MAAHQPIAEKAKLQDVPEIQKLVQCYADRGEMLPRPLSELYEHLRDFFVVRDQDGRVCGSVALHVLWSDIAEIKALAVRQDVQGLGLGRILSEACIDEARTMGIARVFAFTYKLEFFLKLGFHQVEPITLPRKIWGECFRCPKFGNCDELAVVRDLQPAVEGSQPEVLGGWLPIVQSPRPDQTRSRGSETTL